MPLKNRRLTIAIAAALIALVVAAALPRPARADWRSLSGLLPAFVGRVDYEISPDSQYVAYVADADTDDVNELYIVPLAGGAPRKLNPSLVEGGDVTSYALTFTPDSSHVLYLADQEVDNRVELWSVPVGGGQPIKLNGPLVAGGNVGIFRVDAKNQRVVYVADQETNDVNELWSAPLGGGQSIKLNGPLVTGGDIGSFQFDPLSNRVVYDADAETDGKYELYSVPAQGGAVTKLNMPITLGGGGDGGLYAEWAIDPVAPVVVFMALNDGSHKNLFMIPTAGGIPPQQLNFNLLATQRILNFRVSPTGNRVVFNVGTRSGSTNAFKGNLYSTLIGGGGNADLTEKADPLYGVDYSFQFTPDGKRVVYGYQKDAASTTRLETADVASGQLVKLYEPGASDPALAFFRLSGDSQWVAYFTSNGGLPYGLSTVPIGGGGAVGHGTAQSALITADSGRIIFAGISGPGSKTDLFSEQIFGGGRRDLSGMKGTGYIGDIAVSPDGAAVVFLVQLDSRYELRVSDGKAAQPDTTPTQSPSPSPSPTSVSAPDRRVLLPLVQW